MEHSTAKIEMYCLRKGPNKFSKYAAKKNTKKNLQPAWIPSQSCFQKILLAYFLSSFVWDVFKAATGEIGSDQQQHSNFFLVGICAWHNKLKNKKIDI